MSNVDYLSSQRHTLPRLRTPIAAVYSIGADQYHIMVYYIDAENAVSVMVYHTEFGVEFDKAINGSIAIRPNSRCLAAVTVGPRSNSSFWNALVFLEAPSGNITLFSGRFDSGWKWQDTSSVLDSARWREDSEWNDESPLGCPCTTNQYGSANTTGPKYIAATFFNPELQRNASISLATQLFLDDSTDSGLGVKSQTFSMLNSLSTNSPAENISITRSAGMLTNAENLFGNDSVAQTEGTDQISRASDIIAPFAILDENGTSSYFFYNSLGLVVNETFRMDGFSTSPSKFPFNRLAWLTKEAAPLFVFHQINESSLAEEEYVDGAGWVTRLIPVSTTE